MSTFKKQFIVFIFIFSSLTPFIYAPIFTPRVEAFLGIGDVTFIIDGAAILRKLADAAGQRIAKRMVDDIVKSTVQWANTGFEGGPGYVTNPKQFALNTANSVAGQYIEGTQLGFLCSPFQTNIRLALRNSYFDPKISANPYQCTFTGINGNLKNFYTDFKSEGWSGWFSMTQDPNNNPYDSYIKAKVELDSRIAQTLNLQDKELATNSNYLSYKDCLVKNPDQATIDALEAGSVEASFAVKYDPTKPAGACIEYGPVKTPGSVLKQALDNSALPAGITKLISVDHIEQLVGAFSAGLFNRYVTGKKGTFGSGSSGETPYSQTSNDPPSYTPPKDIDEFCPECRPSSSGTSGTKGTGGGQATDTPTYTGLTPFCSADWKQTDTNTVVEWTVTNANSALYDYVWTGDESYRSSSYSQGRVVGPSIKLRYSNPGIKYMSVGVLLKSNGESATTTSTSCGSVEIVAAQ
ncbi:hypothetical protein BH11PAT3_BH11PAT3_2200 [soil metagenome]